MTNHPLNNHAVVACASRPEAQAIVRWYAYLITGLHKAKVHMLPSEAWTFAAGRHARGGPTRREAGRRSPPWSAGFLGRDSRIGLLVSDWDPDVDAFTERLRLVQEWRIPAVFVREDRPSAIRRVWVATSGGPNTLPLMWVAGAMASAVAAPVRILRFVPEDEVRRYSREEARPAGIEHLTSIAVGMPVNTSVEDASDLASALESRLAPDDFLILGAPGSFRLHQGFAGSLPDLVARRIRNPLLLMMVGGAAPMTLRRLFWGRLVQPGLRVANRESAIRHLAHTLGRHHQIPEFARDDIVTRALRQPVIEPLVSECETVLHHVALPNFMGIAGSMGICREGVDVGCGDDAPARFFFLLLTPEGFCEEYLQILARIAKRMDRPDVRESLLACEGPAEVLDVFEPGEQATLQLAP